MNETPTPHSSQQGGTQQPPFGAGFFTWIRGLGISRGYDRWFAGVAGGIAQRANIDPIIVRGIFIVLAVLGGPGILLYLAGWVLLPDQGGKIHLEEVFRGRSGTASVIATVAVAIFVVFPLFFGMLGLPFATGWSLWNSLGMPNWLSGTLSVLVWIAVIGGAIALVSRMALRHGRSVREQRGSGEYGADQNRADQVPPSASPLDDWSTRLNDGAEKFGERANAWGENVGRQAEEWSARYAEEYDRNKLGAAHVVITLACALLAAGGLALWALSMGLSSGNVLIASLLAATGVLALSLIVAGIRGRHSGWVGFLATCGVIALVFTALLPGGTRFQPVGEMSVGSDAPAAVLIVGKTDIDLENLTQRSDADHLEVWQGFGSSTITLPEETPVILNVRLLAGSVTADHFRLAGPLLFRTIDTRASDSDYAPTVTLTLFAGSVELQGSTEPRTRSAAELDDQRISDTRKARLEATLEDIRDEIADTKKELVR